MEIMVKNMVHLAIKETLILWPITHSQFCACFTMPSFGWITKFIGELEENFKIIEFQPMP